MPIVTKARTIINSTIKPKHNNTRLIVVETRRGPVPTRPRPVPEAPAGPSSSTLRTGLKYRVNNNSNRRDMVQTALLNYISSPGTTLTNAQKHQLSVLALLMCKTKKEYNHMWDTQRMPLIKIGDHIVKWYTQHFRPKIGDGELLIYRKETGEVAVRITPSPNGKTIMIQTENSRDPRFYLRNITHLIKHIYPERSIHNQILKNATPYNEGGRGVLRGRGPNFTEMFKGAVYRSGKWSHTNQEGDPTNTFKWTVRNSATGLPSIQEEHINKKALSNFPELFGALLPPQNKLKIEPRPSFLRPYQPPPVYNRLPLKLKGPKN